MSYVRVQDMPLMQAKKPNPAPPTGLSSTTLHQETPLTTNSKHDQMDCYSDAGYPTLPRPKVILSLRHSDAGTWSRKQASLLQTVPVRIHSVELKRARSLSLDTVTTHNNLQQPPIRKALQPENKKVKDSKQTTSIKPRIGRSKSLSASKLFNGQPASKSPLLTDCRDPSLTPPALLSPTQDMSTNHGRVLARKTASEVDKAASSSRSKKPRKIGRAITFSFGAGSDKKRRSLGFLGKAKDSTENDYRDVPASPILTSRKNNRLTSSVSTHDFQQRTIFEETDSKARHAPVHPHQEPVLKNHFGSCRDFHSIDETEETRRQPRVPLYIPVRRNTESPDISPSLSEFSSRQNSLESLSLSLRSEPVLRHSMSTPPSRSHSPINLWRSHDNGTTERSHQRKLSDPAQLSPDLENSEDNESVFENGTTNPRSSNLKKRNTFCVRENKLTPKPGWHEMRHHVVRFLLETEQSYVQSLRTVIKVYMEPLYRPQASALMEPHLAKDIFYQIPEVYQLHEKFVGQVAARVEGWTPDSKIGDVFVNTFSKCHLMDVYRKFIGNFMRAKSAIEIAKQTRPVFGKFLEQRAKDSKGRFTLDDLLIKPVQRIPRYVLFIKDLLKHTSVSHYDHAPLQQALGELTALAERVNTSERERGRLEEQRELIAAVDGLAQLINPQSRFIRYDMVTELKGNVQKRDRFLILFSDMVVCACARRKSTGFIRGSLISLNSPFVDALKHTVKWHTSLTKVSRAQLQGPTFDKRKQNTIEKMLDNLRKDEKTLQLMMEQSITLHTPHQSLVTTLKNLQADIRERVSEKRTELENLPVESGRIDLVSYDSPSPTQYSLVFPSQRIRSSWEVDFIKAKSDADQQAPPNTKLAPPTSPVPQIPNDLSAEFNFVQSMILQSGRPGTELTCSSIGLPVDCESSNCLWTCAGDSSVGQVSIVDLLPSRPSHTLANITVSDSRISCIAAVPTNAHTPPTSEASLPPTISIGSFGSSSSLSSCSDRVSNLDDEVSILEDSIGGTTDTLDSMSGQIIQPQDRLLIDMKQLRSNSAPPFPDPSLSQEQEPLFSPPPDITRFSPLTLRAPDANLEGYGSGDHCMWLGTENGQLFVYSAGNNLRSRSNRQCIQLEAPVTSIRYHDSFVYVGLSNGVLTIFDASNPGLGPASCVSVSDVPIVSCVPLVTGVGVCSGPTLFSLAADRQSVTTLAILPPGQVISGAVSVGCGVWVSVVDSPTLHLLHVPSGETLTSVDCTLAVMSTLQGYNPIIRQHKSSSLQVTALCATPTHLVAGTSAGVTITFPLPVLEHSLEPRPLTQAHPTPVALPRGHVGPIKFLSSVTRGTGTLLVTGGNGCEDLVSMTISQDVPEASNCLLLWFFQ